ncbi:MAG: hypothetical protein LBQ88_02400 [Treponema sp.]|jgi:hypothetical protein|nr:hypothetical protein [Treponema sp.]
MIAGYKKNEKCLYLYIRLPFFLFILIFIPVAGYTQTDDRASVYLLPPIVEPPIVLQNIEPEFDPPEAAAGIIPPSLQAFSETLLEPPYPEWGGPPPLGPWIPELSPPAELSEALPDAVDITLEPLPDQSPSAEEERVQARPVPERRTDTLPAADSQSAEIAAVPRPVVPASRPESAAPPAAEPRPDAPASISPPSAPVSQVTETAVIPEIENQGALTANSEVEPPAVQEPIENTPFSRVVRINEGQIVEIPYRGNGWVYLGETGGRRGLSYDSRKIDNDGLSFVFRADIEGTYDLKFYRQDYIRGYIINDYVRVIVDGPPLVSDTGWFNPPLNLDRVIATPRWPSAEQEADAFVKSQAAQAETVSSSIPVSPPVEPLGDGAQIAVARPPALEQSPAQSGASPAQGVQPSGAQPAAGQGASRPAAGQTPPQRTPPPAQTAQPPGAQPAAGQGASRPAAGQTPPQRTPPPAQTAQPPAPPVSPGDPADAWRNPAVVPAQTASAGRLPPAQSGIADDGIVAVRPPTVMPTAGAGTVPRVTIPQDAGIDEYISRARTEYEARRIDSALATLDQFRGRFPAGTDEAWWLYGQTLEANSPSRDIRTAIDYYRRLIREFPQSPRYADAQRRISYLERFYFNIQ